MQGLSKYYVILLWPFSDPYPIKLAASYLLKTPIAIKIDNKIYPHPYNVIPCYLFPDPYPIITDNVIYGQPLMNEYDLITVIINQYSSYIVEHSFVIEANEVVLSLHNVCLCAPLSVHVSEFLVPFQIKQNDTIGDERHW